MDQKGQSGSKNSKLINYMVIDELNTVKSVVKHLAYHSMPVIYCRQDSKSQKIENRCNF